jgi:hypothetical protein
MANYFEFDCEGAGENHKVRAIRTGGATQAKDTSE